MKDMIATLANFWETGSEETAINCVKDAAERERYALIRGTVRSLQDRGVPAESIARFVHLANKS
jgi:hypothetical protein